MEERGQDERYDTFEDYSFNDGIYKQIQGNVGGDIYSFPNSVLDNQKEHVTPITIDCLRLRKYLMSYGNKKECQNKNCCQYINYMLNDRVRNDYNSKSSIFDIYESFMNDKSNNEIKDLCMSEIKYMGADKYHKIKKLYNMYNICKLFISNPRPTLSCSYANLCAREYNNIISDYPNIDDIRFCKALKDFKVVLERHESIPTRNCNSNISGSLLYLYKCNQLLEKSVQVTETLGQQTEMLGIQEESGRTSDPQGDKMEEISEVNPISPNSFNATLPITLFSSGIGVLSILLSFYKFTPIGHWLRLRTKGFKGISEHLDAEEYEMQQQNSEYEERNLEYNQYNIAYNSL
ncbi:PIR Superfamily Protein [Plasmodium ovale curtisi]|uniref:PIR Superfamily Protein n=1 Tax=Plasmodium ovale curtisi TaxID=864141 RepID=A0A1A8WTA5_PLAOA|nr:PIR Superfamily Protein [Plasmodium ovale curtisi]SBS99434.1 PIR Superfamily Protein [Plasmodium ovale curtisi]